MIAMPATLLTVLVTLLAIIFYFYTGYRVGQMRDKHGIKAPATTGHPEFDCAYRVQMNTLEQFVVFLPLLWLATMYFRTWGWLPAFIGVIWILGRMLYMTTYMSDPDKRGTGFTIAAIALLALLVLTLIGIAQDWMAISAA